MLRGCARANHSPGQPGIRTLVITVLEYRHLRIDRTLRVVVRCHRRRQPCVFHMSHTRDTETATLTPAEAARRLGVARPRIYALVRQGELDDVGADTLRVTLGSV